MTTATKGRMRKGAAILMALTMACCLANAQSPAMLKKINGTTRLVQDGQPMVLLGGELHNSTSSTPSSFKKALETVRAMGLNALIGSVSWEQVEPQEGKYDFNVLDSMIYMADEARMPLVLIWFASYKNGESSYAPLWVKKDTKRFFRTRDSLNHNTTTLSPLCRETIAADSRAYCQLLKHLKKKDRNRRVCMIQVENEMGAFVDVDHCKEAREAFNGPVPKGLTDYLQKHGKTMDGTLARQWKRHGSKRKGSWEELFGEGDLTRQFFMAAAFAQFAEQVTRAGKEVYPIPAYVNCWIADEDAKPGSYPNGGPRPVVLDIYKALAPSVDLLAPDIYRPTLYSIVEAYHRPDNALFIPELKLEAGNAYYTLAEHDAICFSPFGIEDAEKDRVFCEEYRVLGGLLPLISAYQGTGRMHGFVRQEGIDGPGDTVRLDFSPYEMEVRYLRDARRAHGLAVKIADDEFVVAGAGCEVVFHSKHQGQICKIGWAEEVEPAGNGEWRTLRVLNGDETGHHNWLPLAQGRKTSRIYRIRLYTYPEE